MGPQHNFFRVVSLRAGFECVPANVGCYLCHGSRNGILLLFLCLQAEASTIGRVSSFSDARAPVMRAMLQQHRIMHRVPHLGLFILLWCLALLHLQS